MERLWLFLFFALLSISSLSRADCFKIESENLLELENKNQVISYKDKKSTYQITTTCQRTNLNRKTLTSAHRNMGTLIDIDGQFSYLKVLGKKPFMTILYSFGKETGTCLFVSSALSREDSVKEIK